MPLIIGGNVVDINDLSDQNKQVEQPVLVITQVEVIEPEVITEFIPQKQIEVFEERRVSKKIKPSHSRTHSNREDNLVVVNGKVKKIGKQSKYLLDMLTIDD